MYLIRLALKIPVHNFSVGEFSLIGALYYNCIVSASDYGANASLCVEIVLVHLTAVTDQLITC